MLLNSNSGFDSNVEINKNQNFKISINFIITSICVFLGFIVFLTSSSVIENDSNSYKRNKLQSIKNKIQNSETISREDFKEFCVYSEELENIIYLECHCNGDLTKFIDNSGIHWLQPPMPEELLENFGYIELPRNVNDTSKRRILINQTWKLRIGFDLDHPSGNKYEPAPPHYHRYYSFEENKEDKHKYLDECGNLVKKGSEPSHLYLKPDKILKRLRK